MKFLNLFLSILILIGQPVYADNIYNQPVKIKSNLTVTGNTSLQGVSATATTLTGAVSSSGTFNQTGPFIASSATTLSGLTTVSNTLTSNSTINSNGALIAAGANTLTGPTTVGNTLTLTSSAPLISNSTGIFGSTSPADASAILQLDSTTKSFVPPRMTSTQRDAISSPLTGSLLFNTTTTEFNGYNGAAWDSIGGSGSGSGRVNNITGDSASFKNTAGSWVTFDDGTSLVDGTGGSPSVVTIARTTDYDANGSLRITHSAANGQGEGLSVNYTARLADQSRVQEIAFDYITSSGYADDVMEVWVYDTTNNVILNQLSPFQIKASTTSTTFKGIFQNPYNSTAFRLIFYTSSTSTTAFTMDVDNILSGPPVYNYGLVGSDWKSFTPTGTWNTNTTYYGQYRRLGDSAQIMVRVLLSGAPNSTNLFINMPTGMVIDSSKVNSTSQLQVALGSASVLDDGNQLYAGSLILQSTTTLEVSGIWAGNAGRVNQANPFTFGSGDEVNIIFTAPILGWSSNVQMSDDAELRVVSATYGVTTGASTTSANPINFETKIHDTHNAVTTGAGTWKFTAPTSGYYRVGGTFLTTGAANLALYKNGTNQVYLGTMGASIEAIASVTIQLNAGDYIQVFPDATTTPANKAGTAYQCLLSIEQVQGPSSIAPTEWVSAKYTANSLTNSIPNTSSPTIFDAPTKVWDTHGAVTTGSGWAFTCPITGKYRVTTTFLTGGEAWTAGDYLIADVTVNGTTNSQIHWNQIPASATIQNNVHGSTVVPCTKGEPISVVLLSSRTGGTISTIEANHARNQIIIEKVSGF
mgnify:CR=1 FL=1